MNKQRLEQMVLMLRALPPEKRDEFSLLDWKCETTACAVGHACLDPVFIDQGLVFNGAIGGPAFGRYESWLAVEKFFEIDGMQSEWLFGGWHYPGGDFTDPDEVADRISGFIEAGSASCPVEEF